MTTYGWQRTQRVNVPNGGSVSVPLQNRDVLEKLTIWASAGVVSTLSFQLQVNGVNFGAAVAFAGPGVLSEVVFQAEDGTNGSYLIPVAPRETVAQKDPSSLPHPFGAVLVITDTATAGGQDVTVFMTAIGRGGG